MYVLKTSAAFDSAHLLYGYNGKCANIHGHHWIIEVQAGSSYLQENGEKKGMVMDFSDLKQAVRSLADSYDHTLIYERDSLKENTLAALLDEGFSLTEVEFRPTAENFAAFFFSLLKQKGIPMISCAVYETPDNCAVFREEN